jgi:outer membrane assembly lipoprotein YfiO
VLSRSVAAGALMSLLGVACASAPPYSGWTPEQLFEHGQRAFDEGDWSEARRAFERLVLTFPGFDQAVEARHYLARSFYADDQFLSAVSEYTRIVQVYPEHERTREAWMGLCRSYAAMSPHPQRDQQYTIQARTTCENVAGDFQGMPVGDSAAVVAQGMHAKLAEKAYAEGNFYFQRDILESAELVFLDLLNVFRETEVAPRALVRLIEIYEQWEWDEQEEEFRTRLLRTYPDSPEAKALEQPAASDTVSVVRSRAPPGPGRLMAWMAARG